MAEQRSTRDLLIEATIDRGWVVTDSWQSLDRQTEVLVRFPDLVVVGPIREIDGALGIVDGAEVYVDPVLLENPNDPVQVAAKALYASQQRGTPWESVPPSMRKSFLRDARLVVDALTVLDRHQVPSHIVQTQECHGG